MKIKSKKFIQIEPTPVYDILNSPTENFLVKTNSSYIVSHNCAMMDEVDYAKGSSSDEQSKMMKMYATIKRRMESRFMKLGVIPGMLLLVSSKNSEDNFLEQYINDNLGKPYLKIIDDPLWVVKQGQGNYCGETFFLAVGDKYRPSHILSEDEDKEVYGESGQRVIEVPIEHKEAFEQSMNQALTDIAGIAVSSYSKFLSYDKIKLMYKDYLINPFLKEIIELGFDDNSQMTDFLDISKLSALNRKKPHYVHWDTSKTGDVAGFAMTTTLPSKQVRRIVRDTGLVETVTDIVHKVVLAVGIRCIPGQEIPFYKIRNFIFYLKQVLGYNIVSVTADSYQSVDTIQQFKLRGFKSDTLSVDRTMVPYTTLKNAINEERIVSFKHKALEVELVNLEEDRSKGKVDHPMKYSKDISDCIAACVFRANTMSNTEMKAVQKAALLDIMIGGISDNTMEDQMDINNWK